MRGINIKDVKISFGGTELTKFDSDFFTVDELNAGSEIDRIEHALKYGMQKIAYRNFRAFQSFCTKEKDCIYSEYFTYASKLPKSMRFGKTTMILPQVLNLMPQVLNLIKYQDFADKFKPLRFKPQLVKIDR